MKNNDTPAAAGGSLDAQIHRICRMEQLLRIVQSGCDTPRYTVQEALALLEEYYFSPQWLEDYTADEAGLLPPGLSRGVLAEDTIYNLITD